MRRLKVILEIEEYKARRRYFLKQDQADAYVLLDQKMILLHKKFLSDSLYLQREFEKQGRKICILEESFSAKHALQFLKVVGCLYGLQCCFERTWQVLSIYQMVSFLQIKILKDKIEQDFRKNFDEYGFFILFSAAQKFQIQWLREMCIQQLLLLSFEQINFNRYDLILCEKGVVEQIIRVYKQLVDIGVTNLVTKINLKNVIKQYCKQNQTIIQVDNILYKPVQNIILENDQQNFGDDEQKVFKIIKKLSTSIQNTQDSSFNLNKKQSQQQKQEEYIISKIPCLTINKNSEQIDEDQSNEEIKSTSKGDKDQSNLDANCLGFGHFSKMIQEDFLKPNDNFQRSTNLSRKINSTKIEKRIHHRSISPPSSPNTPQFGEYLKIRANQNQNANKKLKIKKLVSFNSTQLEQ